MRSARPVRVSRPLARRTRRPSIEDLERRTLLTAPALNLTLASHSVVANSGPAVTTGTLTRTGTDPLDCPTDGQHPGGRLGSDVRRDSGGPDVDDLQRRCPSGDTATSNQLVTIAGTGVADAPLAHDASFVPSNQAIINTSVAVGSNGKVVVGGDYYNSGSQDDYDFGLARYNADGSIDTSFNGGAPVHTGVAGEALKVQALAIQPDGRMIAAGVYQVSGDSHFNFAVARYNANGSLDSTFGTNGIAPDHAQLGLLQRDLVGRDPDRRQDPARRRCQDPAPNYGEFALARLDSTGHLDPTYGTGGIAQVDF